MRKFKRRAKSTVPSSPRGRLSVRSLNDLFKTIVIVFSFGNTKKYLILQKRK